MVASPAQAQLMSANPVEQKVTETPSKPQTDPARQLAEFLEQRQSVLSTDFEFADVDKRKVDASVQEHEAQAEA